MRRLTATTMLALLATAVPASADPRPHGRDEHPRPSRDNKGASAGTIVAALLIGGIVGALASTAAANPSDDDASPLYTSDDPDQNAAVHACIASVEAEGNRMAPIVRVTRVTTVTSLFDRRSVNGRVLLAWQPDEAPLKHIFRCKLSADAVERVTIEPMR